ncbi:MAG: hypothetical protein HGB34_00165 [Candidatus Moranbacteria bacterium]|nr:hypothetical protein [Candidatus Moranbacteria bacterium]
MSSSAKELYEAGWRLLGWGFPLRDHYYDTILVKDGVVVEHWSDGVDTYTDHAYGLLGVENDAEGLGELVLCELNELSRHEVDKFPEFILTEDEHQEFCRRMEDD